MYAKRLGLGILTTMAAMTLAACDEGSSPTAPSVVAPRPLFARGGNGGNGGNGSNPNNVSTGVHITMLPSSMQLAVGGGGWFKVTLYDRRGSALPDNDGSLVWYGCTPADPAIQTCMGFLSIAPVYPNLRDAYVSALAAGTFTIWADDGAGHRVYSTVTVQ